MPVIHLITRIHAPVEICFDLARSVELHLRSTASSHERVVGGVMTGLMGLNDEVTWEAVHLGIRQRLTSRITIFERPYYFRDSMMRGAFKRFDHDHLFEHHDGLTTMKDVFDYTSPFGLLGKLADWLVLESYMQRLLRARAEVIRTAAEAGEVPAA